MRTSRSPRKSRTHPDTDRAFVGEARTDGAVVPEADSDGNVHDHKIVDVTCGSFEKETAGPNPHSGAYGNDPRYSGKNAADLETNSCFVSAYREQKEDIPHTRNNWICYDFKERRIVPTHYTIRKHYRDPGNDHLRSWLVEMSADGKKWR
jgi:hypothetical protein